MYTQMKNTRSILPGLMISILISLISQYLTNFIPNLGAALIAIFLGILLGNTFLNKPYLKRGTKFSEKTLLEWSIVLNGMILDFQIIKQVGSAGFIFVILQMVLTILFAYWIGAHYWCKRFHCKCSQCIFYNFSILFNVQAGKAG